MATILACSSGASCRKAIEPVILCPASPQAKADEQMAENNRAAVSLWSIYELGVNQHYCGDATFSPPWIVERACSTLRSIASVYLLRHLSPWNTRASGRAAGSVLGCCDQTTPKSL